MIKHVGITVAISFVVLVSTAKAAIPPIHATGKLPPLECDASGDVCSLIVPVGRLIYVDGSGYLASQLDNFTFTIIQGKAGGTTNITLIADFDLWNHTVDAIPNNPNPDVLILNFRDSENNYVNGGAVTLPIPRGNLQCNTQPHQKKIANLIDIFASGAVSYEITQGALGSKQGKC
jgi:hypothetical protein